MGKENLDWGKFRSTKLERSKFMERIKLRRDICIVEDNYRVQLRDCIFES